MKKTVDVIVEGGKATAGPPLGPALGPLGVSAGDVVSKINEATSAFSGIKVPIKVLVDTDTKQFEIDVGSPPTAELLKSSAGAGKGAGDRESPAGDISLEKLVELAKAKTNSLSTTVKGTAKEVIGTALSIGITVDGKNGRKVIAEINDGAHDSLFPG